MKKKTYTVTNTFHGSEAQTTLTEEEYSMMGYPDDSAEQMSINRRAKRLDDKLCGCSGCQCSDFNEWDR